MKFVNDNQLAAPVWLEFNIQPRKGFTANDLLTRVVTRAVVTVPHYTWHFFREGLTLRLRFHTRQPSYAVTILTRILEAEKKVSVASWWRGAHGVRGKTYVGEEDFWGSDWPLAENLYMRGAETALALILSRVALVGKKPKEIGKRQPFDMHANRAMHLLLNQLGYSYLDEAELHADMAAGYIRVHMALAASPPSKAQRRKR